EAGVVDRQPLRVADEKNTIPMQESIERAQRPAPGAGVKVDQNVAAKDDVVAGPAAQEVRIEQVAARESNGRLDGRVEREALRPFVPVEVVVAVGEVAAAERVRSIKAALGHGEVTGTDVHGVDLELPRGKPGLEHGNGDRVRLLTAAARDAQHA